MKNRYLILFQTSFYLSAFTFGGGYVIIPLLKSQFVDKLKWIEEEELLDIASIAQSSPGSVAVNASILIGYKIKGTLGALITLLGTILPPLIILSIVSNFYDAFKESTLINAVLLAMSAAVAAVVFDVVIQMLRNLIKEKDMSQYIILLISFVVVYFFNISIMLTILVNVLYSTFLTLREAYDDTTH